MYLCKCFCFKQMPKHPSHSPKNLQHLFTLNSNSYMQVHLFIREAFPNNKKRKTDAVLFTQTCLCKFFCPLKAAILMVVVNNRNS